MRLSRSTKDRIWSWIRAIEAARGDWSRARPLAPRRGGRGPALAWTGVGGTGVNVVGYYGHASGVGESARLCLVALRAGGIPYQRVDCTNAAARGPSGLPDEPFPINVLHVNADETPRVCSQLGWRLAAGRYNIGVWHWELASFPEVWGSSFGDLDEIWAPSRFIQDAISEKSPLPVVYMPHAIDVEGPSADGRELFGLPRDAFLFLAMYETASVQARKNPEGVVDAFRKAFDGAARDVHLVLKVRGEERRPGERQALREALAEDRRIHLIEGSLERRELTALEAACDAFVSLHRAEGFGLPLAECMFLGKPVVATNWSGNVDFANEATACAVSYELKRLEKDEPPYRKGEVWAEPDLDHAASLMRRLVDDEAFRRSIANAGRQRIRNRFSPEAVGDRMGRRLEAIARS